MSHDFTAYITDRMKASNVFSAAYDEQLSVEAAQMRLQAAFKKDLINGKKLKGHKPEAIKNAFEKTILAIGGRPEDHYDALSEILTLASSAAVGSDRGCLLEGIAEDEAKKVMAKYPNLVAAVNTQVQSEHLIELADLQVVLTNGVKIDFTCQIGLWGGGQQGNRADKYLAISAKTQTVYHIVADAFDVKPLKALVSKRDNGTKKAFATELKRTSVVYATEIEALVLQHSS